MCGIVGFAGGLGVKHERAFAELLIMNQLRGFDSVGVAKLGYSRLPEVQKDIVDPVSFINSNPYIKMLKGLNRVLIGHNRAATQGTITAENAHPFSHNHITGVHNGTLTYRRDLEEYARFPVDSDNLYYHMSVKGEADLWTKLFGAASLVWWDSKEETLNFLRNKDRPMYLAYDKEHTVVCWASEYYMLLAACSRNGIVLDKAPFATEVDMHYAFHMGKGYHNGKEMVPVTKKLPTYVPFVHTTPRLAVTTSAFTRTEGSKRPSWLTAGSLIDVIFEDQYIIGNNKKYEGFVPLDDRINVMYTQPLNTDGIIDLKHKTRVYKGVVNAITTVWRKGFPEWDVRVHGVHRSMNEDGNVKTLEDIDDERDMTELQAFLAEAKGELSDHPSEPADSCSTLCTYKNEKNCKMCQRAFGDRKGGWTTDHMRNYHCDWCGTIHSPNEVIYVTNNRDEGYCMDCFPYVLQHLDNKYSV